MPSYVYSELFGCSDRSAPCRRPTSDGEVSEDVWGEACFIFRFVSLKKSINAIENRTAQKLLEHTRRDSMSLYSKDPRVPRKK